MSVSIVYIKAKAFALRIIRLRKYLTSQKKEYTLSEQVLRSGTSIGANLAESMRAISDKDFLNKLYIALKECTETKYWIELLYESDYISESEFNSLHSDNIELEKILLSATKTMKYKIYNNTLKTPNH